MKTREETTVLLGLLFNELMENAMAFNGTGNTAI
jgi:hypothetical protein